MNNEFYVYAYLRPSGEPYYIGKGKGNRAWKHSRNDCIHPPKNAQYISVIRDALAEDAAFFNVTLNLIGVYPVATKH